MTNPSRPSSPLVAKLAELLATDAPAPAEAPPPPAAPVALSDEASEGLKKTQQVVTVLTKQTLALQDRMNLLRAACEQARLLPVSAVYVVPALQPQLGPLAAMLRADRAAAMLVAPAVLRFGEVRQDIQELTDAVQRGESKPERLEAIKGKHAFLPRIHLYFKDVPLVAALFQPPAPPTAPGVPLRPVDAPALPPAGTGPLGAPRPVKPAPTGPDDGRGDRLALSVGAPRPEAGLRGRGTDQLTLSAGGPKRPPEAPMAARGPALLRAIEVKMAILQAGWAGAQDPPGDPPKLPAVLAPTVRAVAATLRADAAVLARATHLLAAFRRARELAAAPAAHDRAELARLLTELGTLPLQFRGVPAIGPIFAAA